MYSPGGTDARRPNRTRSSATQHSAAMDQLKFKTGMSFAYGEPAPMGPAVVRIVAPNAGPFTFKGTNTYLVGSTSLAVIDPGPDDPAHHAAILKAAGSRRITHILTTHAHRDHVDGVDALRAATGAEVCGFGRDPEASQIAIDATPAGTAFVDYDFMPDRSLAGGDLVEGADWALTAIHTPGHAPDHLSFALEGRNIVFSGDHVMAWNTSVVAPPEGRMADYIASLEILLDRNDTVFLPGHGGRLEEPQRTVKAYLLHRRWREQAVLKALKDGATSIRRIVPEVYQGLATNLIPAATLSVQAHVEYLIEKGLVSSAEPLTLDRHLEAV
jgi:glyoxylase-like metal-dependent hydrolase (beta-lactamase superfamily II)